LSTEISPLRGYPRSQSPPTLPNTPLPEPLHRFFVADETAGIAVSQILIDFLENVDVVLDIFQ
jgi:hypothetical protein